MFSTTSIATATTRPEEQQQQQQQPHRQQPTNCTITAGYRPRVCTMPATAGSAHMPATVQATRPNRQNCRAAASSSVFFSPVTGDRLHRVRSYSVTAKGVTRYGTYSGPTAETATRHQRQFGSWSTFSVGSSTSAGSNCSSPRHRSWSNGSSSSSFSDGNNSVASGGQHSVAVTGSAGVGKSSLIAQFVDSNVACDDDDDDDDDDETQGLQSRDKVVSILLDGEEAQLQFLDFRLTSDRTDAELLETSESGSRADAYVIVYSVADRQSFSAALRSLSSLKTANRLHDKAAILVGNKIDLERCRSVSTMEGREMARSYGCKFIETSDWMDHNVDELLVGIVNQIRLKQNRSSWRSADHQSRGSDVITAVTSSSSASSPNSANGRQRRSRSVVRDFFRKITFTSKSCDNLYVI